MGWRGSLGLVLALLVASAVLYHEIAGQPGGLSWRSVLIGERGAPPGEQIVHLFAFDPADIVRLRLQRGDRKWQTERRSDGRWSGATRSETIDDFLNDMLGLAEIMPIDVPAAELADHGLNPPQSVVDLERGNQPPIVLLLGHHNPPATATYAQLGAGGRVVLTGALANWDVDQAIRALSPTPAAP